MHRFFVSELSKSTPDFILSEEESKHACRVLRLTNGQAIEIINGKGDLFIGEIVDNHPKRCAVKINNVYSESPEKKRIHIAISPTKNMDRFEWFVEKATEIGVNEITPLFGENSERKTLKRERLDKLLISATKQSKRLFIPQLNEPSSTSDFIAKTSFAYIAHCETNHSRNFLAPDDLQTDFTIMVGPEGDFSNKEIHLALSKGFKPVTLGDNRLRTETAGIYAVTLAKIFQHG